VRIAHEAGKVGPLPRTIGLKSRPLEHRDRLDLAVEPLELTPAARNVLVSARDPRAVERLAVREVHLRILARRLDDRRFTAFSLPE
jgi:hypothetical protein